MSRHRPFLPLLALAVALSALGACGRRGSLEPPGTSAAVPAASATPRATPRETTALAAEAAQATGPDAAVPDEDDAVVAVPSPAPGPGARRRKGYAVPPGPFILDPIL